MRRRKACDRARLDPCYLHSQLRTEISVSVLRHRGRCTPPPLFPSNVRGWITRFFSPAFQSWGEQGQSSRWPVSLLVATPRQHFQCGSSPQPVLRKPQSSVQQPGLTLARSPSLLGYVPQPAGTTGEIRSFRTAAQQRAQSDKQASPHQSRSEGSR